MGLRLPDKWIWDFWLAEEGGLFHLFYLQAPRTLGDPNLRHWHASIGHAVSTDLVDWELRSDALGPGAPGSWDDLSTWTGSIQHRGDHWYLLYTGTSRAEDGLVQRIGVAMSRDLDTWERVGDRAVIEPDPQWYETLDLSAWHDQAWRDPWVIHDPTEDVYHAYITARANHGPPEGRGVIGHARSADLVDWEVMPPLTAPAGFGQMEVPQVITYQHDWYLVFCSDTETQSRDRRATGAGTGTYYARGLGPLGPFAVGEAAPLYADPHGSEYAGKLVRRNGSLLYLAWEREQDGFVGVLTDPRPVLVSESGDLTVR